jgi:hypothetical protein
VAKPKRNKPPNHISKNTYKWKISLMMWKIALSRVCSRLLVVPIWQLLNDETGRQWWLCFELINLTKSTRKNKYVSSCLSTSCTANSNFDSGIIISRCTRKMKRNWNLLTLTVEYERKQILILIPWKHRRTAIYDIKRYYTIYR